MRWASWAVQMCRQNRGCVVATAARASSLRNRNKGEGTLGHLTSSVILALRICRSWKSVYVWNTSREEVLHSPRNCSPCSSLLSQSWALGMGVFKASDGFSSPLGLFLLTSVTEKSSSMTWGQCAGCFEYLLYCLNLGPFHAALMLFFFFKA